MNPQAGVVLAQATLHEDVVGLLEADPVAVIVPHLTILDDGAKAAVEKNAGATTAVEIDILLLVPLEDEIFHTRTFQVVAGDDWKDGGGLGLVPQHAIGIQRRVDGERVAILSGDSGDGGVEPARLAVPNSNAVADLEAVRIDQRDLFFAVI